MKTVLSEVGGKISSPVDPKPGRRCLWRQPTQLLRGDPYYNCRPTLSHDKSVYYRPMKKKQEHHQYVQGAAELHSERETTSLSSMYYNTWIENRSSVAWCQQNFIRHEKLNEAQEIRCQLGMIMERLVEHCVLSWGRNRVRPFRRVPQNIASSTRNKEIDTFPTQGPRRCSSIPAALFKELPPVVYHEVKTKRSITARDLLD